MFGISQEARESGETASQSGLPLPWAVYVVRWISGMSTIVMGMSAQEAVKDWKYLSYAIFEPFSFDLRLINGRVNLVWMTATVTFVYLKIKPTKTFVMYDWMSCKMMNPHLSSSIDECSCTWPSSAWCSGLFAQSSKSIRIRYPCRYPYVPTWGCSSASVLSVSGPLRSKNVGELFVLDEIRLRMRGLPKEALRKSCRFIHPAIEMYGSLSRCLTSATMDPQLSSRA